MALGASMLQEKCLSVLFNDRREFRLIFATLYKGKDHNVTYMYVVPF